MSRESYTTVDRDGDEVTVTLVTDTGEHELVADSLFDMQKFIVDLDVELHRIGSQ